MEKGFDLPPTLTIQRGIEFVLIPAGRFKMGYPDSEKYQVHEVTINQPFYLTKYPITQLQWSLVASNRPSHFNSIHFGARCPNHPAEGVSYPDTQKFIEKLRERKTSSERIEQLQRQGYGYRLPTEAEWEYACRAGNDEVIWPWGNDGGKLRDYAWYKENSDGKTHPVGEKKANAWGLHDMLGNVWEWCQESDQDYYKTSPNTDPQDHKKGDIFVGRGGGCSSELWSIRPVSRIKFNISKGWFMNIGLRVAFCRG